MGNPARGATVNKRPLSDFEEKILANIAEHGCQVNTVFDPDGKEPTFSYSIGFPASVRQPEVIVFGLSRDLMHAMVNSLHHQCREGLQMRDGLVVNDLLEGHSCVLKYVLPENIVDDFFASALWLARHRTGHKMDEAFQIVWPGAEQALFPWDDGCNEYVIEMQPALYRTESVH